MNKQKKLVFLCGARDFHAIDWYKSAKSLLHNTEIVILTDLIAGEGYKKIITDKDKVENLIILDRLLFRRQSKLAHIWRNILKLMVFPIQVILIRRFATKNKMAVYHAHSMYYLFLAWVARISYVGTPQGSDILIKPYKSLLYKYFAIKSIRAARAITVDSVKMKTKIKEFSGIDAYIIQNGIDIESITSIINRSADQNRDRVLSIRGFTALYRIKEILKARNNSLLFSELPLTFIYPFSENQYLSELKPLFKPSDKDLSRVDRNTMYELLLSTKLVISIPISDSSPRSVYEAIFCGAAVSITYHPYYDTLPDCMKSRIILININENNWFDKAVADAELIVSSPYMPSEVAINLFDQKKSFLLIEKLLFHKL